MERFTVIALLMVLGGCAARSVPDVQIGAREFVPAPVPKCNRSAAAASVHGLEAVDVISGGLLAAVVIAAALNHSGAAFSDSHGPGEIRGLLLPSCTGLCC